jgi:uncharacterized membrane protein YagU involved in acid resistance
VSVLVSSLAGGFLGTLALTTLLRAASELGFTRMDLPFLLGTSVTDNRRRAKVYGYIMHFALGISFALLYGISFAAIRRSNWWLGALVGILHALFTSTVLVNVLLPIVHRRMGTPETAADEIALLEPPGFLMLNYGRNTFVVTLISHIVYGAIVGWAVRV